MYLDESINSVLSRYRTSTPQEDRDLLVAKRDEAKGAIDLIAADYDRQIQSLTDKKNNEVNQIAGEVAELDATIEKLDAIINAPEAVNVEVEVPFAPGEGDQTEG